MVLGKSDISLKKVKSNTFFSHTNNLFDMNHRLKCERLNIVSIYEDIEKYNELHIRKCF